MVSLGKVLEYGEFRSVVLVLYGIATLATDYLLIQPSPRLPHSAITKVLSHRITYLIISPLSTRAWFARKRNVRSIRDYAFRLPTADVCPNATCRQERYLE